LSKTISLKAYLLGLAVVLICAYVQYVVTGLGLILGMLVVYGIPIVVLSLLWGSTIISRAFKNGLIALRLGIGFYGAFTGLGIIVSVVLLIIILVLNPSAVNLLNTPNPVLQVSPSLALLMIFVSILIVGPAEEYLFRGFIYGGMLSLSGNKHWFSLAFLSSLVFAAAHLYYALTYGIASLVLFSELVCFGMAMAATYYLSGGNLLMPALIHGVYDATGFLSVVSLDLAVTLREFMLILGLVVALGLLVQWRSKSRVRMPEQYSPLTQTSPKTAMIICPFCSSFIRSDARFCPNCGKELPLG
jgi:uncharacterized protein